MAQTPKTARNDSGGGRRLVIVESPAKAKTIAGYLGKDYRVEPSMGHIRDLPHNAEEGPAEHKGEPWARLGVNVDHDFEPLYVVDPKKKSVVTDLRAKLAKADELLLATDEDREGEAIAWHLVQVLKPTVPVRRMVFHEITRQAIERALGETREIDERLVDAQETRRILDRLYGDEGSPVLWRKVMQGLSGGGGGGRGGPPPHPRPPLRVRGVAGPLAEGDAGAVGGARAVGRDAPRGRARTRADEVRRGGVLGRRRDLRPRRLRRPPRRRRRKTRGAGARLRAERDAPRERRGHARRGRRPRARGCAGGLGVRGPVGRREAIHAPARAAVHDLDAAAGGEQEAPPLGAAGDADRPTALRERLHHLHAHRLDDAVGVGSRGR